MLLIETDIGDLVEYINLWSNEYALNLVFHGQYGKHAAWTVGNVLITGIEIAPGRILCEFDNFDLKGANDTARRATGRLLELLNASFSFDDTPNASRVYEITDRQIARTFRVIPAIFADNSLDAESEVDFKAHIKETNTNITEEELSISWNNFYHLVEQQRTKREEQKRRRSMTAKDAMEDWLSKITIEDTGIRITESIEETKMDGEEFARQLQNWKQDLINDVVVHFKTRNVERGRIAFDRWKERFTIFLNEKTPGEAVRFEKKMRHFGHLILTDEHPYETFMREDGNTCLAFIDDLMDSALKGRIIEVQNQILKSQISADSPSVFLSYASEDIDSARRLYNDLQEIGVNVWFDKESLLPGQNWNQAVRKAIKTCRFFLALLSENSLNKVGFVQKETKYALEVLDEYPGSVIYLIPARLDACTPSDEKLQNLHWANMFPDWNKGLNSIIRAIESQK